MDDRRIGHPPSIAVQRQKPKFRQRPAQPQLLEEYTKAKDVTRHRLFIETLEGVMGKSNKVIIEGGEKGHGVVPYLILPEIEINQSTTAAPITGVK